MLFLPDCCYRLKKICFKLKYCTLNSKTKMLIAYLKEINWFKDKKNDVEIFARLFSGSGYII